MDSSDIIHKRKSPEKTTVTASTPSSSATSASLRSLLYAKKWDEASLRITSCPHEANIEDKMGDLPLHEVCHQGAPFHVIQKLVHANKPALQKKGFCGRLPLHYAAYSKPSVNVIKLLLRHYPQGAKELDLDGRLPLHLAVVRNAPKQSMQALIEVYPKALTTPNAFGNTPIMLARNEHVANLLMEEASRPRGVEKGMQLERKLVGNVWRDSNRRPLEEKKNVSTRHAVDTNVKHKQSMDVHVSSSPNQGKKKSPKGRTHVTPRKGSKYSPRSSMNSPRSPIEIMAKHGHRKSIPSPERGVGDHFGGGGGIPVMSNYRKIYLPSPTHVK